MFSHTSFKSQVLLEALWYVLGEFWKDWDSFSSTCGWTQMLLPPMYIFVPRPPVLRMRRCRIVGLLLCILHYPTGGCVCVCAFITLATQYTWSLLFYFVKQVSGGLVGFILTLEHFQQYGHFYSINFARTETWGVGWGVCPFSFYCLHFLPSMFGNSLINSLTCPLNLFNDTFGILWVKLHLWFCSQWLHHLNFF